MAHVEHALRRLADHGEGLRQELGERRLFCRVPFLFGNALDPLCEALSQLERFGSQAVIRERRHRRLESVDRAHRPAVVLKQPIIAATEHRLQYAGNHRGMTAVECKGSKFITLERLLLATRGRWKRAGIRDGNFLCLGASEMPASAPWLGGIGSGSAPPCGSALRSAGAGRWRGRWIRIRRSCSRAEPPRLP